jgi:uncharacterized protein (DUF2062 family)
MTYWESVIQNAIGCTIGSLLANSASYLIYYRSTKKGVKICNGRNLEMNERRIAYSFC